ncbi:YbhB/YbcL family Raf kinase inhibitor-like protein [Tindallia californiensis]|uniref:Phospholipid-binding protein, PBP family n=1 Tax=Tindallia californiensis TaxID=159292 RepID=A0A1H3IMK8_9FIRM|nr:YbhB/YbcL family Raf kinase inhibitor-like protein [Tindallia californiensis]SDY28837.1 phospholipid-binding protein, PBP family [Tindallia californiensis]
MAFALSELKLTSSAFEFGKKIPQKHTGEGVDVSPSLSWQNIPEGTKSFAVVCHDPDAPKVEPGNYGFVHWVLYNIPGDVTTLPEGTGDFTTGMNDFGKEGFMGPMPPEGHGPHYYYFMIFALDENLHLEAGLTLWELFEKIEPHVLGMNRLIGEYERF